VDIDYLYGLVEFVGDSRYHRPDFKRTPRGGELALPMKRHPLLRSLFSY